ncbi:hypothetical protein EAO72_33075 [Streptomyces sp. or43]|nr:hypothetical protein EAO72_33075 [Streptomyces sp. or43]
MTRGWSGPGDLFQLGTAEDGRLFANEPGGVLGSTSYWWVPQEARPFAPGSRSPWGGVRGSASRRAAVMKTHSPLTRDQ